MGLNQKHVCLSVHAQYTSHHMPKQRRLDSETKDEAVKLLELRANKKLFRNHLMNTTGKTVTLKDLHNIAARNVLKFRNDFRELV